MRGGTAVTPGILARTAAPMRRAVTPGPCGRPGSTLRRAMSAPTLDRPSTRTLRWPGGSARLGPWHGQPDVATVTVAATRAPSVALVEQGLDWLRAAGYATVVTNALAPGDALPFVDAGFRTREHLHLLAHDLRAIPSTPHRTRRASRRRMPEILELDNVCFDDFWRFDAAGLQDAIHATPAHRVRIGLHQRRLAAYAITGRAGGQGYIQRIGVDPGLRRSGWASALLADALTWLRTRGARRALVNTQFGNDAARTLYEACGFKLLPVQLCVLERTL